MKTPIALDDVSIFLAAARTGSLSAAARATGRSLPTLSRRIAALERRLETSLFLRGATGLTLTSRGRALMEVAGDLVGLERRLASFAAGAGPPRVRITAGMWTSRFLARALGRLEYSVWTPELLASNARVDVARREADIGVRNRRPDQSWLAGRSTVTIAYAEYASGPDVTGYITLTDGAVSTPTDRWVRAERADQIVTSASDSRLAADLACHGLGRVVLPCFAGESLNGLQRVGPIIDSLCHQEWLVAHHEARHDPPVRAALDAIHSALCDPLRRPAP